MFNIDKLIDKLRSDNTGHAKINLGIGIIILSPLLGVLLFNCYILIVGHLISTNNGVFLFWLICTLVIALLGISITIIGCFDKLCNKMDK